MTLLLFLIVIIAGPIVDRATLVNESMIEIRWILRGD